MLSRRLCMLMTGCSRAKLREPGRIWQVWRPDIGAWWRMLPKDGKRLRATMIRRTIRRIDFDEMLDRAPTRADQLPMRPSYLTRRGNCFKNLGRV